ncbi:MAG TPA: hypothetical protein VMS55_02240 [Myxococcota bacterium]|nr:hypothetical protein [Myxococcota bacterium]
MELERAHEILGLSPGASAEEIESAYRRVKDDLDARLARVRSSALRDHYTRLRQELEPAREAALAQPGGTRAPEGSPDAAYAALGLSPDASALDVASAYVTSCDELERELAGAQDESVRRACLAARAEIDAAYQRCAARPLRSGDADESEGRSRYETQVASEPFAVTQVASEPFAATRGPAEPMSTSAPPTLVAERAAKRPARRARRVRLVVAVAVAAALAGAGAALLRGRLPMGWSGLLDWSTLLSRFQHGGPPAELIEAYNTAEYLRRRMGEERRELQARVEENRARVTRLEEQWTAAPPVDYDRMAQEIGRARERAELTAEVAALSETYVFESADVAEAYGKIELGTELRTAGDLEEATAAFEAAWLGLEQALGRLDLAEEAVGARSEAQAALAAWEELARSSGLQDDDEAHAGREVFERGRALLARGAFAEAVPELRGAARHFSVAIDDGRKRVAGNAQPEPGGTQATPSVGSPPPEASPSAEAFDRPVGGAASASRSPRIADVER